jgi:Tat protein secretion system quality control protein TatD with DNase activity
MRSHILVAFSSEHELQPMLDAHIHLTHAPETLFPDDMYYFTNAASPDEWSAILKLSSPHVMPFLGIHPECGSGPIDDIGWEEHLKELHAQAVSQQIGIGECGIDQRYYTSFSKSEQLRLLVRQIRTAIATDSPLCVHLVHATESFLTVMGELTLPSPWIMHGFTGSVETARRMLDLHGYISLSPTLMRSERKMKDLLRFLPTDRILIELDYPYTYIPQQWQEYSYEQLLFSWYQRAAETKAIDTDRLIDIVLTNGTIFTNKQTHRR